MSTNPNDRLDCSDMDAATDDERRRKRLPIFQKDVEQLLNTHSMENASGTPDFILAKYLTACLRAYEVATVDRDAWHSQESR